MLLVNHSTSYVNQNFHSRFGQSNAAMYMIIAYTVATIWNQSDVAGDLLPVMSEHVINLDSLTDFT